MSEQFQKLVHADASASNECAQCADGEFFMLRDGQIGTLTGLGHDEMTANLSYCLPASLCKGFRGFFPRDIGKSAHAPRLVQ